MCEPTLRSTNSKGPVPTTFCPYNSLPPASQRALLSITRSALAERFSTNSGVACVRWNTTLWSSMISTPCATFLATSSIESVFPMPIRGRQKPASVCTDSGWVIRNTAWRTSLAVNSPQLSWNLTPLRRVMVQVLPSGDISHFSASSGIYAPVLRSIPTRYSSAGRLSSWPLRLCSQVKLVSQPRGATATLSRSSFALAGVGCAQAPVAARLIVNMTPNSTLLVPRLCIVPSSVLGARRQAYGASLTYSRWVKKPVITPGNVYSATYLGFTAASANSQNSGISANSLNL